MSIQGETPFVITVPHEQLSLLSQKLALTTLPDEIDDARWDYGAPLADITRLVNRWKNGFDWRKQEAALNAELPQFTRDIAIEGYGTLNIHYVHKKSQIKGAIPLLFVHGWPGSFIEVRKVLPLLIEASPDHPSFHVVAISLPGYGFSTAPSKKGFEIPQYAEVAHKLMLALGYGEYVTQGGDWGYRITRKIAELYGPKHSKAWHTNFPISGPPTISRPLLWLNHALSALPFLSYSKREIAGFERTVWFQRWGRGYYAEQTTRPQTVGYSLTDSPVGLLAWIYEKLVEWTDSYRWDDDEILTWVSIYWFSRAGPTASTRIYYEAFKAADGKDILSLGVHTKIPVGYSYFPKELVISPRSWTQVPNLVFQAEHEEGGHFAAYEKPEILVGDLRKMFGKGGGAFGVVKDKNGYDA
ncbi:Epoxide hydrolase 1 [Termitomyces sp. T112]|nr:Epoxide hydrolase 1 [Termitomyces sp. T112]